MKTRDFLFTFLLLIGTPSFVTSKFLPGPCTESSCLNNSTCHDGMGNTHWCRCAPNFSGDRCNYSPCMSLCSNGAACERRDGEFKCICRPGWTGPFCQFPVPNACQKIPCGPHGECQLGSFLDKFSCKCHKGWTGERCNIRNGCGNFACENGGSCVAPRGSSQPRCICPVQFRGEHCTLDVNECSANPCLHGRCVNKYGGYECDCERGFGGKNCERKLLDGECSSTDLRRQCKNGGFCEQTLNSSKCVCPPTFQGDFCEEDVDECVSIPCENGGTCMNEHGGFKCTCVFGYEGETCRENRDECADNPCQGGATCVDGIAKFYCNCPPDRVGMLCELENPCETRNVCKNGVCNVNPVHGNYSCLCPQGFRGEFCEIDIDECSEYSFPCEHGGTCINDYGSYHCECVAGYEGPTCEKDVDECANVTCFNHGTCFDHINRFQCICMHGYGGEFCERRCPEGFTGRNCQERLDSCQKIGCHNGGTCKGDTCLCPAGYIGSFCDSTGDFCDAHSCPPGQTCIQDGMSSTALCVCPLGYEGEDCSREINECGAHPCQHGGTCEDLLGDYMCYCPVGYTGRNCETAVDHCTESPCLNGGVCINEASGFVCHCGDSHHGDRCQFSRNPCAGHRCDNGARCLPSRDYRSYTCACSSGYAGQYCDQDVNECERGEMCANGGTCHNAYGTYKCTCAAGFEGKHCEVDINECTSDPCMNNATCVDLVAKFNCICQPGFTGRRCAVNIDDCASNPCQNGATCLDAVNNYECACRSGFSGRNCEMNDDDCRPGLCLNGGRCVDGVNDYSCTCQRGYTGKNCQTYVNLDQYNHTDRVEGELCMKAGCTTKAGDGRCDAECNFFACNFDGGDCSAKKATPFEHCHAASYCSHVFRDGTCNEICNNEQCLFDGFDCEKASPSCPVRIAEFCREHYANGLCDNACNSEGCGWDGGDCDPHLPAESTLGGEVVLIMLGSPDEFVDRVNEMLMTLSRKLRATVRVKRDGEGRPMIYSWDSENGEGELLPFPHERSAELEVVFGRRQKRTSLLRGVSVWIEVDVAMCRHDCFSDVGTVANYLAAANAKKDLDGLGMQVYSAYAKEKDQPSTSSHSTFFAILIGAFAIMIVIATVFTLQQRDRKRRLINAPIWMPPSEMQSKHSTLDSYGDVKRFKYEFCTQEDYQHPHSIQESSYNFLTAPVNRVVVKKPPKKIEEPPKDLHLQALSDSPISKVPFGWHDERALFQIEKSQVNSRGPFGRTPLMCLAEAVCKKSGRVLLEDATRLLDAGADIDAQDDDGFTAIFHAVHNGKFELVKLLCERGADVMLPSKDFSTVLHVAATTSNTYMTRYLLTLEKVKAEINVCDAKMHTPLMLAAANERGDPEVARLLVSEGGADVNFSGDKGALAYTGRTALHFAAQLNTASMIQFLCDAGANRDAQDLEERTPIFLAASEGRLDAVKALLDLGASPEITDQKDRTPKDVAHERHFIEIVAFLEQHQATMPRAMPLPTQLLPKTQPKKPAAASKPPKRVAVKKKVAAQQVLTPPNSDDGSYSSPSPNETLAIVRGASGAASGVHSNSYDSGSLIDSPPLSDNLTGSTSCGGSPPHGPIMTSASSSGYWPNLDLKPACEYSSPNHTSTFSDSQHMYFNGYVPQMFDTPQTFYGGSRTSSCQFESPLGGFQGQPQQQRPPQPFPHH